MSLLIDKRVNGCYAISARGLNNTNKIAFEISEGDSHSMCVALSNEDAIEFCRKVIQSLNRPVYNKIVWGE